MKDNNFKLLMTTDTLGGVWDYSLELCRELQHYGAQVHLISMGRWPNATQEREVSRLGNVIFYRSAYKLEWMEGPWEDVAKAKKWIAAIYHTVRPDLVHFNNFAHLDTLGDCPIITVYHSCVLSWWKAVKGVAAPGSWNIYRRWVANALKASDVVVSPSHAMRKQWEGIHRIGSASLVIHNGRRSAGPKGLEKEPFILCSGRIWDQAKNLQVLSQLADRLPWPIYVAGEWRDPTTGKVTYLEGVNLLGKLSIQELSQWMQRASIYLSPSKYEPFGLGVLEAAKAGCALALANLGSFRELWGDSARYFDCEDVSAMAEGINALIGDPGQRHALAAASRTRAQAYSGRTMAEQYIRLYRKLLAQGRPKKEPLSQAL